MINGRARRRVTRQSGRRAGQARACLVEPQLREASVRNERTSVGLDVHARSVAAAGVRTVWLPQGYDHDALTAYAAIALGAEMSAKEELVAALERFSKERAPSVSAAEAKRADAELNRVYRALERSDLLRKVQLAGGSRHEFHVDDLTRRKRELRRPNRRLRRR